MNRMTRVSQSPIMFSAMMSWVLLPAAVLAQEGSVVFDLKSHSRSRDGVFDASPVNLAVNLSGDVRAGDGRPRTGIEFDGDRDFLEVPFHRKLDLTTAFTIAGWVLYLPSDDHRAILLKRYHDDPGFVRGGYMFVIDHDGRFAFTAGHDGDYSGVRSAKQFPPGGWHHYCACIEGVEEGGNIVRLYVDGDLHAEKQIDRPIRSNNSPLYVGGYPSTGGAIAHPLRGTIDGLTVHGRVLKPEEVNARYELGRPPSGRDGESAPVELQSAAIVDFQGVAIQDVCAWPNLTLLPDGTIVAAIFNQPAHANVAGDVECWASTDRGRTWSKRGVAGPRTSPDSNRLPGAAGLAANGDLLSISFGWGTPRNFTNPLTPIICRSSDSGRTWSPPVKLLRPSKDAVYVPFGDIMIGQDGSLRIAAHSKGPMSWMLRSDDDGRTWSSPVKIGGHVNETAILHLGEGKWLAVCRTRDEIRRELQGMLRVFRSDDDGRSWQDQWLVTEPLEHPAHLLKLKDGRVLLTYGDCRGPVSGIEFLLSSDGGRSWDTPQRLIDLIHVDNGYPSTVQLEDGTLLTAYYTQRSPEYRRYEMGVIGWHLPK